MHWRPRAHLFGHHHEAVGPLATEDGLLVGLEHLFFRSDGSLQPGAWGILELGDDGDAFAFAGPETDPWVDEVTRETWRDGS